MERVKRKQGTTSLIMALALFAWGCGSPTSFDAGTASGKKAIIETTNKYLSTKDCASAVETIEPVYKSANSDNDIRMITSSAYACWANFVFFKTVGDIVTNGPLMTVGFWSVLAKLFPSNPADPKDRVLEGSLLASDALMTALKPGLAILPTDYISAGSYNPGSTVVSDRIDDANAYLLFISMNVMGALENRFGNPDPTTHSGGTLPWNVATAPGMTTNGCAFGSALVNFADTIGSVADAATGDVKVPLTALKDFAQNSVYKVCGDYCALVGKSCPICPLKLRDRTQCTGQAGDLPSEVTALLVQGVNSGWNVPVP